MPRNMNKTVRYDCDPCKAIFRMSGEEYFSITWLSVRSNNRKYDIKLYPGITGNAPEFVVYSTDDDKSWKNVMRLDFIPQDWTPQNAADKLKTALLFL
jgi:hypothetical protein